MVVIGEADLIESIADALQYISYYHPPDFVRALAASYEIEESPVAKDAIRQILVNSRMCAQGHRPICQDTGIVNVFVKWGQDCRLESRVSLQQVIDAGVRAAYLNPDNPLRASIVEDPAFARRNTGDNTPAVVHVEMVTGAMVEVTVAAKGGGSENKARLAMLNPSDSAEEWVLQTVAELGAGWCPPGILGIGIGGTAEQAVKLAKQALMAPVDMAALRRRGPSDDLQALRIRLYDRINALGIGAQGLGGLTTVLDVKIGCWPTHAASKPVAIVPNCAAARHVHFTLDGSGPARLEPPRLTDWPDLQWAPAGKMHRVDVDRLSREQVGDWRAGDRLLLSGWILTARDAAHSRMQRLMKEGKSLPVNFAGRVLYYVGPVQAVGGEVVGPAGPTTARRMDGFTSMMLDDGGVLAMIGKAERGDEAIEQIKRFGAAYLVATGGAAYLISKAVKEARLVAFEDLGMEAVNEFRVEDMPVTVAIDSLGQSIHKMGPMVWQKGRQQRV